MEITRSPAPTAAEPQDALALASGLHAADRRQREPYASHLLRVTIRIPVRLPRSWCFLNEHVTLGNGVVVDG